MDTVELSLESQTAKVTGHGIFLDNGRVEHDQ